MNHIGTLAFIPGQRGLHPLAATPTADGVLAELLQVSNERDVQKFQPTHYVFNIKPLHIASCHFIASFVLLCNSHLAMFGFPLDVCHKIGVQVKCTKARIMSL